MIITYVTYVQKGVKKKASMKETQYQQLLNNPDVTNIETYPNSRLMEQSFKTGDTRRVLLS